jgi:NAD(P)-dependent dehydrogenase (short-subunit alcohol dehydrogenase family)
MKSAIVVTGVSSGIGYDAVRYLSRHGYFVFGSVRSLDVADRLVATFPESFQPLVFDLLDRSAVLSASRIVQERLGGHRLRALVNNAGIAEGGPLQLLDDERFRRQLEVSVIGTRNVINAFLPLLGAGADSDRSLLGPPGKIINITSISGIFNTPMNGAYCVAKHAVESLGEVYRRELMQYGIDVVSIQPGPIQSRLWEKSIGSLDEFAGSPYARMIRNADEIMRAAQRDALPAEIVSRLVDRIITSRRPKPSYIVHSHKWRVAILAKVLPARLVDRLLWRRLNRGSA